MQGDTASTYDHSLHILRCWVWHAGSRSHAESGPILQDDTSNPGTPFAVGLTLERLDAQTVDEQLKPTFVSTNPMDVLRKVPLCPLTVSAALPTLTSNSPCLCERPAPSLMWCKARCNFLGDVILVMHNLLAYLCLEADQQLHAWPHPVA